MLDNFVLRMNKGSADYSNVMCVCVCVCVCVCPALGVRVHTNSNKISMINTVSQLSKQSSFICDLFTFCIAN